MPRPNFPHCFVIAAAASGALRLIQGPRATLELRIFELKKIFKIFFKIKKGKAPQTSNIA